MLKNKLKKVSKNVIASLCSLSMLGGLLFSPMPVHAAGNTAEFNMNIGFYFKLKDVKGGKLDDILIGLGVPKRQIPNFVKDLFNKDKDDNFLRYLEFEEVNKQQIAENKFSGGHTPGFTNIQIQYDATPPLFTGARGKEQLLAYSNKDMDTVTRITKMRQSIIDTVEAVRQNVTDALVSGDASKFKNVNLKKMVKDPNKEYFEAKKSKAPSDPSNIRFRIIASEEKTEYDQTKDKNFDPEKVIDGDLLDSLGIPKIIQNDPAVIEDDESRDGLIYTGFSNFVLAMTDTRYLDRSTDNPRLNLKATFPIIIEEIKIPVTYKYVDLTGADVPAELQQKAPKNTQEYVKTSVTAPKAGEKYTPATGDAQADFTDTVELSDGSQWTFKGWKTDSKGTQDDSNLNKEKSITTKYDDNGDKFNDFIGVWENTRAGKVTVTYEFVSKDKDIPVPSEIEQMKPNGGEYKPGESVQAEKPKKDGTEVEEHEVDGYTWKFNGYKVNGESATELTPQAGADNKFVGEWERLYKVTYKENYPGKENDNYKVVSRIAKNSTVGTQHPDDPTRPDEGNVSYEFKGWSETSNGEPDFTRDTPITDNKTVYAIWEAKVPVTYEFKSKDSIELPEAIKKLQPSGKKVTLDSQVTADKPKGDDETEVTEMTVDGYKWKFNGYKVGEEQTDQLTAKKDSDNKFVGEWERVYNVTYEYENKASLPEEVQKTKPKGLTDQANGSNIKASNPTKLEVPVTEEGVPYVYKFVEWDKAEKTIEGDHIKFVGKWTKVPKLTVTYHPNYPGAPTDPIKTVTGIEKGLTVGNEHPTDPTRPNKGKITYTFTGWNTNPNNEGDPFNSDTPVNGNTDVYAIWEANIPVEYEFVKKGGGNLPEEITKLLPKEKTVKAGTEVTADKPQGKDGAVKTELVIDGKKWKFNGYTNGGKSAEKLTASEDGDNKFVGEWEQLFKQKHKYVDEADNDVPNEVKALLPDEVEDLSDGAQVQPGEPKGRHIDLTEGEQKYRWKFKEWKEDSKVVQGDDVEFVAVWTKTPLYTVTYVPNYPNADPNPVKVVPDIESGGKVGDNHPSKEEEPKRPNEGNKTYTFIGWNTSPDGDGEEFTPDTKIDGNKTVYAIWRETIPATELTYFVTHKFVRVDDDGTEYEDLPTEVTSKLPPNQSGKKNGESVKPGEVDTTQIDVVENNVTYRYNFIGWDAETKQVENDNVEFVGKWTKKRLNTVTYYPNYPGNNTPVKKVTGVPTGGTVDDEHPTTDEEPKRPNEGKKTYTFVGWSTDPSGNDPDKVFTSTTIINGDTDVFAIWRENEPEPEEELYTVTYMNNYPGGDEAPYAEVPKVKGGTSVDNRHPSNPNRPNDGEKTYTFIEWNTSPNGDGDSFTSSTLVNGNITVFAIWRENEPVPAQEYSVIHKFVSDDGSELPAEIVGRTPANQTGKKTGETVTPTAFDTSEYRVTEGDTTYIWSFDGWDSPQKEVGTENVTFTGTWSKRVETPEPGPDPNPPVNPDPVDPVPGPDPDPNPPVDPDPVVPVPDPDPNPPVDPEPNPPVDPVKPTPPTEPVTPPTEPVKTYTVTYKNNYPGGDEHPYHEVPGVEGGTNVGNRHPADPTRPNEGSKKYTFKGWNTSPDGNGESFTSSTIINGDLTVYAIWEEVPEETTTTETSSEATTSKETPKGGGGAKETPIAKTGEERNTLAALLVLMSVCGLVSRNLLRKKKEQ